VLLTDTLYLYVDKTLLVLLRPPQISHEQSRDRIQASAVTGRRLN